MHLRSDDRLLVVAPHPDDETLACGGLLGEARRAGAAVRVVVLTLGDAYPEALRAMPEYGPQAVLEPADFQALARLRKAELLRAAAAVGVSHREIDLLAMPDMGLLPMWNTHWSAPWTSRTTNVDAVPYRGVAKFAARHTGRECAELLANVIRLFSPTIVAVPWADDTHFDHRGGAAFVAHALLATACDARELAYVVHRPDGGFVADLPSARGEDDAPFLTAETLALDDELLARKQEAFSAHRSQQRVLPEAISKQVTSFERFVRMPRPWPTRGAGARAVFVSEWPQIPELEVDARDDADVLQLRSRGAWTGSIEIARVESGNASARRFTRVRVTAGRVEIESDDRVHAEVSSLGIDLHLARDASLASGFVYEMSASEHATGWRRVVIRERAS